MSEIAETIQDFEKVSPRVLADLESVNFEIRHMRGDVEGKYSETDLDEAYRLIMGNQVSSDDFKQLTGQAEFRAQTIYFENLIVLVFPSNRYEAVFASFDYREDFPVNELIDRVSKINSAK